MREGRIVAVGSSAELLPLVGSATRVIELGGATLVPGFKESHAHLLGIGFARMTVDLVGARSYAEVVERVSASEAHRLGMVNHVVPRASLTEFTMALAQRIAKKPMFALKMAKEAVNSAEDVMGRRQAMKTSFGLHQLCHSHNLRVHDARRSGRIAGEDPSRDRGGAHGWEPQRARMTFPPHLATILLLTASNVFMTFAWYGHLKHLKTTPWVVAAFVSWGIALFEYLLQVPANRIGSEVMSVGQLKVLQ